MLTTHQKTVISSSGTIMAQLEPWPMRSNIWKKGEGFIRRIPFCYVDRNAYERLGGSKQCRVRAGINLWAEALGGAAAVKRQHSLGFREPGNPEIWCCRSYKLETFECDWDFNSWPPETLAIHWMPSDGGVTALASLGYAEFSDPNAMANSNWIHISDLGTASNIAHELGHGKLS